MTEEEKAEASWSAGYTAAMSHVVQNAYRHLPGAERDKAALVTERANAIAALREVCRNFGDNNWPDDLDLADIIEKHLLRHLV